MKKIVIVIFVGLIGFQIYGVNRGLHYSGVIETNKRGCEFLDFFNDRGVFDYEKAKRNTPVGYEVSSPKNKEADRRKTLDAVRWRYEYLKDISMLRLEDSRMWTANGWIQRSAARNALAELGPSFPKRLEMVEKAIRGEKDRQRMLADAALKALRGGSSSQDADNSRSSQGSSTASRTRSTIVGFLVDEDHFSRS